MTEDQRAAGIMELGTRIAEVEAHLLRIEIEFAKLRREITLGE